MTALRSASASQTTQHLAYTDADVNRSLAPSRGREVEAGEYEQRQARVNLWRSVKIHALPSLGVQ